jgi:hypothetical protein
MTTGVLRLVCINGLIVGDSIESIKVPHKGDIKTAVIEGAFEIVKTFDVVSERVKEMKALPLREMG